MIYSKAVSVESPSKEYAGFIFIHLNKGLISVPTADGIQMKSYHHLSIVINGAIFGTPQEFTTDDDLLTYCPIAETLLTNELNRLVEVETALTIIEEIALLGFYEDPYYYYEALGLNNL